MKERIIPESKTCKHCQKHLPASRFSKAQASADGLQCWCNECKSKSRREANAPILLEKFHKKHGPGQTKRCRVCDTIKHTSEFRLSKNCVRGVAATCKECINARVTPETKRLRAQYTKEWRKKNKTKRNQYERDRMERDPSYKAFIATRKRISSLVSKNIKKSKTRELIGCSPEFLRKHLESKFTDGMTWDNYGRGGWHIDHIYPCAQFDLTNPEEQAKCFHWSNLQPLWESENCSKNSTIKKGQKKPLALQYA